MTRRRGAAWQALHRLVDWQAAGHPTPRPDRPVLVQGLPGVVYEATVVTVDGVRCVRLTYADPDQ